MEEAVKARANEKGRERERKVGSGRGGTGWEAGGSKGSL